MRSQHPFSRWNLSFTISFIIFVLYRCYLCNLLELIEKHEHCNDERSVETGGDISTEHVFHTTVSSNVYNIIWYILYWTFCFRFNGCIQRSSFEFLFLLILSCLSELLFYATLLSSLLSLIYQLDNPFS
jgi:hypothetical protein